MSLRRVIFWVHLISGLVAGTVIAIMSVTGIAIAFEEEILAWLDRDVRRVTIPAGAAPLPLEELRDRVQADIPDFPVTAFTVPRNSASAYGAYSGRNGPLYVDPYSGRAREARSQAAHEWIHTLEEWHRWLGMDNGTESVGRLVTGISNLAFLVLCLTGLYLWWPRRWSRAVLRRSTWFASAQTAKARNFNWHHVFGFWSLPVLLVLAATGVVISFGWAHRLVFIAVGEEAPQSRNYGMMAVPRAQVPPPPPGAAALPMATVLQRVAAAFPDWESISIQLPVTTAGNRAQNAPLDLGVTLPDFMPSRAYVPVEADPYTGEILQATRFQDRSAGLQARVWIRFLHTGAGFGLPGKVVATLATAASLVLVYTGFALAWRRFSRGGRSSGAAKATARRAHAA